MKLVLPLLITAALLLSACSKNELHDSMESMGDSFKAMKDSNDLATLKTELNKFKAALEISKQQKVPPEDQATYDEGIKEIASTVEKIEAALAAENTDLAKSLFKELGKARKTYHEKLGVD